MNEQLENVGHTPPPRHAVTGKQVDEGEEEQLEENEPYLGPAWAAVMLVLYLLKQAFPAEMYTALWWFQIYVICLVIAITVFTLVKRHQFYKAERDRVKDK